MREGGREREGAEVGELEGQGRRNLRVVDSESERSREGIRDEKYT